MLVILMLVILLIVIMIMHCGPRAGKNSHSWRDGEERKGGEEKGERRGGVRE